MHTLLHDSFEVSAPPGSVIGSTTTDGLLRDGIDVENVLAVDNGALRIGWLQDPGWNRAELAYGPFELSPGLHFAVALLPCLTTSQTHDLPEGPGEKLRRLRRTFPRPRLRDPRIRDSLAVGLFPDVKSRRPLEAVTGFVLHADPRAVGELRTVGGGGTVRAVPDLQNLPLLLAGIVRDGDVLLLAASMDGAPGLAPFPSLRPLAVQPLQRAQAETYVGIHQSVLGEVLYRVDTRVYGVRVARSEDIAWHHGAHAADRMTGTGPLDGIDDLGNSWNVRGDVRRTEAGTAGSRGEASIDPGAPTGFLRALVRSEGRGRLRLGWRADRRSEAAGWSVEFSSSGVSCRDGSAEVVATSDVTLRAGVEHVIHITDDSSSVGVFLDGRLVFDRWLAGPSVAAGSELSLTWPDDDAVIVRRLEAHPPQTTTELVSDLTSAWPASPVLSERGADHADHPGGFPGAPGQDIEHPGSPWTRRMGQRVIEAVGDGQARVRRSEQSPDTGRTVYAVDWTEPDYADIAVTITCPGSEKGLGERGRSGLAFWQDEDNHLVINNFIDDSSVGVSISAFLRVSGHEVMREWDATWSNVGSRIRFGTPYDLRIVFDGERFLAFVDGQPVLYRALSDYRPQARRLRIRAVGLVANWEWGDDSGSVFSNFRACGRQSQTYGDGAGQASVT